MKKLIPLILAVASLHSAFAGQSITITASVTFDDRDEESYDRAFTQLYSNAVNKCANNLQKSEHQVSVRQITKSTQAGRLGAITISANFSCQAI